MILVPRRNLYLPQRFGRRDRQRGIILLPVLANAGSGIELLGGNGGTISATDGAAPHNSNLGLRFFTDGTVEKGEGVNGALTWSSHGTWIRPLTAASGNFSVRYTNRVGTLDFTTKAAAEDSFIAITSTRTWIWNETGSTTIDGFDCDFEVRDDVGSLPTSNRGYRFEVAHF